MLCVKSSQNDLLCLLPFCHGIRYHILGELSWKQKDFPTTKRMIIIITGSTPGTSCGVLFWQLEILTLTSQYVLFLMRFIASNLGNYKFNTSIHDKNTRHKLKLHKLSTRLPNYQKSVYYNSINVYNRLPNATAELVMNKKLFSWQLKKYLTNPSIHWRNLWIHDRHMMEAHCVNS